jgi:glycosyltransferase A (GT-A) superfamily protein (DUF2064 family)
VTQPGTRLLPVEGEDIGACLAQALEALLDLGYRKALAINADGPSLPAEYIHQAANSLDRADLVLGPVEDGGYYLVGMQRLHTGVFTGIAWSTTRVIDQTLQRSHALGLSVALTPPWYDIDSIVELKRLNEDCGCAESSPARRFLAGLTGSAHKLAPTRVYFPAGDLISLTGKPPAAPG